MVKIPGNPLVRVVPSLPQLRIKVFGQDDLNQALSTPKRQGASFELMDGER